MIRSDLLTYAQVVNGCYDDNAVPTFQDATKMTHVFHVVVNGVDHFNFDGTLDVAEWLNRDFDVIGIETFKHPLFGPLHNGFARGALGVTPKIAAWLRENRTSVFTIGGHSKGAGEAQIAAAELRRLGFPAARVYLFEPPRAGTFVLKSYLASLDVVSTKTINGSGSDMVTEVPPYPWVDPVTPIMLRVSDGDNIATKHKIPAVIAALEMVEV